jgi:single-strand DNA-binding protein
MNLLLISGRLGQDAETKYTASGTAVCSFSVAVDSGYGDNKKTNWFRCSLFGKRAEGGLVPYLVKGQQVIVTGEVSLNEWQSDSGTKSSLNVFVDKVQLVGGKSDSTPQQAKPQTTAKEYQEASGGFEDKEIPFNKLDGRYI